MFFVGSRFASGYRDKRAIVAAVLVPDSGEYDNSGIGSDLCLSYQTRVYGRCPKEAEVCRSLPSTNVRRRKRHGVLPKATNESLGPGLLGACFSAGGGTDRILTISQVE